ncbi:PREDICTED: uncharacterized protein LOC104585617 isoform X2 [Nelumbo nucifera]|uniref:Uncharacterized protein LOC104585617 isoform X2 n=1 Tax=Nelumbo nucifera TaxID=4432 RepID=A0A1U7YPV8_NELNU|nr:PREDICTED: uncharacterized protein LOC104585617 isoform X2 [Nelumbo nucifera]XP_010240858.1 PREDICTED: uncharacterized protein LOC104585617 isoform X2 [Nelumbo nucifera]
MLSSRDLLVANAMSSTKSRHLTEMQFDRNLKGDQGDHDELYLRMKAQKEEILQLREKISEACIKELQLLNEKHVSERKYSDLRMALDQRQKDAITSALAELAHRKDDLEENIKLAHDLKDAEDERYIFTSSMLGLLAEYGIRPHAINASTICNNVKRLYDQLQWKIITSHASIVEIDSMLGNQIANGSSNKDHRPFSVSNGQPQTSTVPNGLYTDDTYLREYYLGPSSGMPRFVQDQNMVDMKGTMPVKMQQFPNNYEGELSSTINKGVEELTAPMTGAEFHLPTTDEEHGSSISEGVLLPSIEDFQIIGEAKPGNTLQACGFPVRGTSLCIFQWVRHLQNGTRQYIEGATVPDYVVTADDVDKIIAVECIPIDDSGRQGELVRLFANDQKKITCDADMKREIDTHISVGRASFDVLFWNDSTNDWKPSTFILKRSSFQIKINGTADVFIEEKYSADLSIMIPPGLSTQFVLTCVHGTYPFSTYEDVRMRDTLVLTMRNFQSKALDDKRKGKA